MNAIKMLKKQHQEVAKMFEEFDSAKSAGARRKIFEEIADALAVHAAIEEQHFYPAVKEEQTEDILLQSVEEHLEIKRAIADLLAMDADDGDFGEKVKALQEEVDHHVEEEQDALFPKVEKLLDPETLEAIGEAMEETQAELISAGSPRDAVLSETDAAAPI